MDIIDVLVDHDGNTFSTRATNKQFTPAAGVDGAGWNRLLRICIVAVGNWHGRYMGRPTRQADRASMKGHNLSKHRKPAGRVQRLLDQALSPNASINLLLQRSLAPEACKKCLIRIFESTTIRKTLNRRHRAAISANPEFAVNGSLTVLIVPPDEVAVQDERSFLKATVGAGNDPIGHRHCDRPLFAFKGQGPIDLPLQPQNGDCRRTLAESTGPTLTDTRLQRNAMRLDPHRPKLLARDLPEIMHEASRSIATSCRRYVFTRAGGNSVGSPVPRVGWAPLANPAPRPTRLEALAGSRSNEPQQACGPDRREL